MKKEQLSFLEDTVRNGNAASLFVVGLRAALDVLAGKRNAEFRREDYEEIGVVIEAEPHDKQRNDMLKALLKEIGRPSAPVTSPAMQRSQVDGLVAELEKRDEAHAVELADRDEKHAEELAALHAKIDALAAKHADGPPETAKEPEKKSE